MKSLDRTEIGLLVALPVLLASILVLPTWLVNYVQVSLGMGLVALGSLVQMRAGLVSFGQGMFFCTGGYAAGMAGKFFGITDLFALLAIGLVSTMLIAFALGFLLRRYRDIFYAMLSLAVSMILFGLLSSAEELGSTDGFNISPPTYLGWAPTGDEGRYALYFVTCTIALICAGLLHRFLRSPMGFLNEAIRENELRVEYLGASAYKAVHVTYVVAASVSALGGVLWAISLGHVDPEMTNWTTSGHFVFIVILAGTGSVVAPLIGAFVLEVVRVYAVELSPNTWQMILGFVMLITILFLPHGLWSLIDRKKKPGPQQAEAQPMAGE